MVDLEHLRDYCLAKKGVAETFPFDKTTLVYKVGSKMFCMSDLETVPFVFCIKTDPDLALELQEKYSEVKPAYHMNKIHWINIIPHGEIPDNEIFSLLDLSYNLVFKGLKKSEKAEIEALPDEI